MALWEGMRLDGAAAFVTGASRGLGRASALALAEAGADLALAATDADLLGGVAEEVRDLGRQAIVCPLDVADAAAATEAVDRAAGELGRLDIAVNAAGICPRVLPLETTEEIMRRTFEVNVYGTLYICQAAARHMQKPEVREAGGGRIVNFGSVSGLRGCGELTVYGASKAAVMNMTMSLAQDWAISGIRVNAVAPGQFDTDMGEPVIGEPAKRDAFIGRVPLGRVARPEEIGSLVVYLCAEASAYVTGSVFRIDGGLTLL